MAINKTVMQLEGGDGVPTTLQKAKAQLADLKAQLAALQAAQPAPAVDPKAALAKLTSNQPLTDDEKRALGLLPPLQPTTVVSAEDAYYTVKVGNTGKTQAQLDAAAGQAAAKTATEKAAADKAAAIEAGKSEAQKAAELKAKQEAEAKAAAEAAAKAEAARIAAEKAAQEAAAKAEQERIAAEKAIADARTAAELEAAKKAQLEAEAATAAAKAELEKLKREAEAALKAAQAKAEADLKAALEAKDAAAIKAAQEAKAAADAATAAAAEAARVAAAEAAAAEAETNINVTGNTVIPFAGTTAADIAAQLAADQALEQKMADRIATSQMLADRFQKYNLTSLAPKIKELAINGANEATIMLELQETEEYKQRFKANQERFKKGLAVLDPGTYLRVEDGYRQVLRSYGLNQFDTDDYVSKFIANDMSPTEFSNRVVTAVQRVQNADPALIKQLNDFYGINSQGLLAYVLDPEQEFPKIERQIAAGEIGLAAARQGLTAGVTVAEQLAAQGISEAEARKGYATIADILPTAEKLSSIYGNTMDTYGQSEAEQEVFNSLASAQRKRQKLTAREVAAFSGSAGTNKTSLTTSSVGQF